MSESNFNQPRRLTFGDISQETLDAALRRLGYPPNTASKLVNGWPSHLDVPKTREEFDQLLGSFSQEDSGQAK